MGERKNSLREMSVWTSVRRRSRQTGVGAFCVLCFWCIVERFFWGGGLFWGGIHFFYRSGVV